MKLISMTDFVLQVSEQTTNEGNSLVRNFNKIKNYANFLKQPLALWMFVPCDDNGNILNIPMPPIQDNITDEGLHAIYKNKLSKYKQSRERILFIFDGGIKVIRNKENFFIIEDKNGVYFRVLKNKTKANIESLFEFSVDIKLTESAIKQIGL